MLDVKTRETQAHDGDEASRVAYEPPDQKVAVAPTQASSAAGEVAADQVEKGVSPLRLALRSFRGHRSAMIGLFVLSVLYFVAIFADFLAPYGRDNQIRDLQWTAPTRLHFSDEHGFSWRPFIYPIRGYI